MGGVGCQGDAVGEEVVQLSPGSLASLRRLSADEHIEVESLLLAPLVKVLGEITAERLVVVGSLAPETRDRACPTRSRRRSPTAAGETS
ncbi:hypothetical protein NKH18_40035 [Streptomyces sp. M10(2022)]